MLYFFESKTMRAQVLYTLIFYIESIITVTYTDEIESIVFPFFLKCLACNHEKIQKLALSRLQVVFNKIQKEENIKIILSKLSVFFKSQNEVLVYLTLKFIEDNLNRFEKVAVYGTLTEQLEQLVYDSKRFENYVNDLVFKIFFKIYKNEEREGADCSYKYLRLFSVVISQANVSKAVFNQCFNTVSIILNKLKKRELVK